MYLEMEMANERANQLLADAANYRLAKQARKVRTPAAWRARLFHAPRWGGNHLRGGQLM